MSEDIPNHRSGSARSRINRSRSLFDAVDDPAPEPAASESRAIAQLFGNIEADPEDLAPEPHPLSDTQLGQAIAKESKLDANDEPGEIYPPALRLGGSAWVPSSYWDADYRRRLGESAQDLQDQGPLRDREDTQAGERSDLMLDTMIFALEDPTERR